VQEVIDACRAITGHPIPAVIAERPPGDPDKLVAAPRKANEVLGWVPKYGNIEEIVESAWKWHQAHPNGYAQEE
jgi:UDP-glucose 4-epimerase